MHAGNSDNVGLAVTFGSSRESSGIVFWVRGKGLPAGSSPTFHQGEEAEPIGDTTVYRATAW